jgi:hypothetical protein
VINWRFEASTDPEIKSGMAQFTVGGELGCFHLEAFSDGMKLHALMKEAYRLGRADSNHEIANMLHEAADNLSSPSTSKGVE